MPASNVDLGRLQDTIKELMEKNELKNEHEISEFIASSVQRPKRIQAKPYDDSFNHCGFDTRLTEKTRGD